MNKHKQTTNMTFQDFLIIGCWLYKNLGSILFPRPLKRKKVCEILLLLAIKFDTEVMFKAKPINLRMGRGGGGRLYLMKVWASLCA